MDSLFKSLEKNYVCYGSKKIHVIIDKRNKIWFNATHITKALGYKDTKQALHKNVDKDDKKQRRYILPTIKKGHPTTNYINEAGLYSLILRSKLPGAKLFKTWVTHEVLPAIRKYGSYKLEKKYKKNQLELLDKINHLEEQYDIAKNDLRKETFPNGALVYVIDYSFVV